MSRVSQGVGAHGRKPYAINLRRSATEAQLGLAIESSCEIELEFDFQCGLDLAFDSEFRFRFRRPIPVYLLRAARCPIRTVDHARLHTIADGVTFQTRSQTVP